MKKIKFQEQNSSEFSPVQHPWLQPRAEQELCAFYVSAISSTTNVQLRTLKPHIKY